MFLEYAVFMINELPVTQICVLLPGDYFGNCGFVFTQILQRFCVIFKSTFVLDIGLKGNRDF